MRFDWSEWRNSGVCIGLVLLACGAALDIFMHKLHKARLPELYDNELVGLEITWCLAVLWSWQQMRMEQQRESSGST